MLCWMCFYIEEGSIPQQEKLAKGFLLQEYGLGRVITIVDRGVGQRQDESVVDIYFHKTRNCVTVCRCENRPLFKNMT